jgi:hypothetical protein
MRFAVSSNSSSGQNFRIAFSCHDAGGARFARAVLIAAERAVLPMNAGEGVLCGYFQSKVIRFDTAVIASWDSSGW